MQVESDDAIDVLLVEDNPGDARLIEHHLRSDAGSFFATPEVTHVEALSPGLERLQRSHFDVVLLDLGLPESTGLATVDRILETDPDPPIVVLTGLDDTETALEAIQRGAQDYLAKDEVDGRVLERSIRYAIERRAQERELERQNERLEEFASVVSHDLRNPVNVAEGRLGLLADEVDSPHVEPIEDALARMKAIIEDVLTLARQGEIVEDPERVRLSRVVRSCWANVDTDEATIEVAIDGAVTVPADEGRLKALFENLFRNAVEHGRLDVSIEVGTIDGEGFYVADDGPGIPEVEREEVFEAGYSTDEDGTGFGLNIVRQIAEAHGWSVSLVESESGGARFEVTDVSLGRTADD